MSRSVGPAHLGAAVVVTVGVAPVTRLTGLLAGLLSGLLSGLLWCAPLTGLGLAGLGLAGLGRTRRLLGADWPH